MNHVSTEPILQTNPQCKDLLIEAMRYHLMPESRDTLQTDRTRVRRSMDLKPVIFAIGKLMLCISYCNNCMICSS